MHRPLGCPAPLPQQSRSPDRANGHTGRGGRQRTDAERGTHTSARPSLPCAHLLMTTLGHDQHSTAPAYCALLRMKRLVSTYSEAPL